MFPIPSENFRPRDKLFWNFEKCGSKDDVDASLCEARALDPIGERKRFPLAERRAAFRRAKRLQSRLTSLRILLQTDLNEAPDGVINKVGIAHNTKESFWRVLSKNVIATR